MNAQKVNLAVFLIKASQVAAFEKEILAPGREAVPLREPLEGLFIPFLSVANEPSWVRAVSAITLSPVATDMNAKSPSALLIIRRGGRTFVIAFGHAWMNLDDAWLELDYGRRVALNAIPKDKVVEIKAEQVFAKWHLASERAPRASSVEEFGVEFDRDLVAAVEGVPSLKPSLGKLIRGATSLRLNLPISDLESALDESLVLWGSTAYKSDWPEIDNIKPVKDNTLIQSLDSLLDGEISNGAARKKVAMFTPSQRRDEPILADSYVYGRLSQTPATTPYLTYDGWLGFLVRSKTSPSVAAAKRSPLHVLDDSGTGIKSYFVYDCFGYDVSLGGVEYVLSSGVWYDVSPAFIARTNTTLKLIPNPVHGLLPWNQVDDEATYNGRCGGSGLFLNCDAKILFYGGQHSQFEFCDLISLTQKTLFFAKIVSKSTGMSHLVEQVRRTTQLLFGADDAYRKTLKKLLKKHHPSADLSWLESRPRQGDWELCMVSLGKKAEALPFFAKCGLVKLYKELREQGHSVSFTTV